MKNEINSVLGETLVKSSDFSMIFENEVSATLRLSVFLEFWLEFSS